MGGFPHSEICGSKVAHTSPQLIAACHVLHRLYVPRHPRIALTSRLRVHTTNDITGCPFGSPTRQSSASRSLSGADDYNLSQIILYDDVDIWSLEPLIQIALRLSASRTAEAILVSKIEHLTASILKNPFTMSNTGRLDPITVLSHGEPFLFIIWIFAGARRNSDAIARSVKNGRRSVSYGRRHGLCPCLFSKRCV